MRADGEHARPGEVGPAQPAARPPGPGGKGEEDAAGEHRLHHEQLADPEGERLEPVAHGVGARAPRARSGGGRGAAPVGTRLRPCCPGRRRRRPPPRAAGAPTRRRTRAPLPAPTRRPPCPEDGSLCLRAPEHPHRLRVDGRGPRRRGQGAPTTPRGVAGTGSRSSTSSTRSRSTSGRCCAGSTRCSCAWRPWSYELSYKMAPLLRAPAVMLDTWLTRRKLEARHQGVPARRGGLRVPARVARARPHAAQEAAAGPGRSRTSPTSRCTPSGCTAASTATSRSARSRPRPPPRAAARTPARAARS